MSEYRERRFALECRYLEGDQVHLGRRSPIVRCLNDDGLALLQVRHFNCWHYILATGVRDGWVFAFDPHPRTTRSNRRGEFEFISDAHDQNPNVKIDRNWLDANSDQESFRLGTNANRKCLLMKRAA